MTTKMGRGVRAMFASSAALLVLSAVMFAQKPAPPSATRDISGFWGLSVDSRKVPAARLLPRITRAMLDLHARRDAHAIRWCNILGVPAIMDSGTPLDIRQGSTTVVIAPENNPAPRYIYLNRKHVDPNIYDQSTNGDSVATWDGDSLVVDTVGFHPTHGVTTVPGGGFKTDKSHLVERYRVLESGGVLAVTFTWTDPTVYAAPHVYEFRYRRLPATYEPVSSAPCDPYDEARAQFLGDPAPFSAAASR